MTDSDWSITGHCLDYDPNNNGLYGVPFSEGCLDATEQWFLSMYSIATVICLFAVIYIYHILKGCRKPMVICLMILWFTSGTLALIYLIIGFVTASKDQ